MEKRRRPGAGLADTGYKAALIVPWVVLLAACQIVELEEDDFQIVEEEARFDEGDALSDEEVDELLAELPSLHIEPEDEDPTWYGKSGAESPPIEIDEERKWSIAKEEPSAETEPDGPLRVMSVRPEGAMEAPSLVTVTFDRPVAQLGRVDPDVEASLSIEPEVQGQWRWMGTRTAVFEPDRRWPRSTDFTVEIGEGLRALDGTRLMESVRFEFSTPRPKLVGIYPTSSRRQVGKTNYPHQLRDVPLVVLFDQPVAPESASSIRVSQNEEEVPMQVLTGEARREAAQRLGVRFGGEEDRMLALSPKRDYGPGRVEVEVEGPIASAEGPEVGEVDFESSRFSTYPSLQLRRLQCVRCQPDRPMVATFSNSIDEERSDYTVSLEPDAGEIVEVYSRSENRLVFKADLEGDQEYTMRLEGVVYDHYGQRLEVDESTTFSVTEWPTYSSRVVTPPQQVLVRSLDAPRSFPLEIAGGRRRVEVRVYEVASDEFHQAREWRMQAPRREPDLREVFEFDRDQRYEVFEREVDYSSVLGDGEAGHVMVGVHLGSGNSDRSDNAYRTFWVQHTDLAATVSSDYRDLAMTVSSLTDGSVVSGAEIWSDDHLLGSTDERGIVDFSVSEEEMGTSPLNVTSGDDSLLIPPNGLINSRPNDWREEELPQKQVLWHLVDERGVYRPGEELNLRGWLRSMTYTPEELPRIIEDADEVEYRIRFEQQRKSYSGTAEIDRFGGFDLRFPIPEDAPLGVARIDLTFENEELVAQKSHSVEVRKYRRPRYELSLEPREQPAFAGGLLSWRGTAEYLTGGPVAGGDTRWHHREYWTSFRPPGWEGWQFSWSARRLDASPTEHLDVLSEDHLESQFGSTDEGGEDRLAIELGESEAKTPRRVTTTFSVTDVDRQSWEVSEEVMVHPANYYVGLRPRGVLARSGEPFEVDVVVVDTEGDRVEGQEVELVLFHYDDERERALDRCRVRSESEAVTCDFEGHEVDRRTWRYRIRGEVRDEAGRVSRVQLPVRIYGGSRPRTRFQEHPELDLVTQDDEFRVGETARVLVGAPHYPLRAEVELRRSGRAERRQVVVTADDPFIEVPVDASMVPNTHLWVSAIPLGEEYRPHRTLQGTLNMEIADSPHRLDVEIEGKEEVQAGEDATFEVRAVDASELPVEDAQVLFFAVDEALLLLSDYELADPIATFYPARRRPMMDLQTRAWLFADGAPGATAGHHIGRRGYGSDRRRRGLHLGRGIAGTAAVESESEGKPATDPLRLRQDFDAVAFFRSDLVTDEEGRVSVTETMPDTLTRYRVMAVVIDGDHRFGRAETEATASKDLMVQPSPPRFVSDGDRFELSLIVHNRSDEARTVKVALRSTEHLEWPKGRGRSVEVPPGARTEVALPGKAVDAGEADIQVLADSGEVNDAQRVALSVLAPATTETFATYGSMAEDDDVRKKAVRIPPEVDPEHGELRMSVSSTRFYSLSDTVRALMEYDYATPHALASQILGLLAVYDRLHVFDIGDELESEEVDAMIQSWVHRLEVRQVATGAFECPFSRRDGPVTSVRGSYALWRAHKEGFDVDARTLRTAKRALERIERATRRKSNVWRRSHTEAYALFVRQQMGDASERDLDEFLSTYGIEELDAVIMGWLLPLATGTQFEDELKQRIVKAIDDRGSKANVRFRRNPGGEIRVYYRSSSADAVILDVLLQTSPEHPLVEKLAMQLLETKHHRRRRTPHVNAQALIALRRYFDAYEDEEPRFAARAWLGEQQVLEEEFDERTPGSHGVEIPAGKLSPDKTETPVVLQRDGEGRMYYRLGLRYVPLTRSLSAVNQGFWVERNYFGVDDDDDVRRTEDGWDIRAGARVRVELTMIPSQLSARVVLVDWIPAGLEVVDPALATNVVEGDPTEAVFSRSAQQAFRWRWWDLNWYRHVNLRDERVEVFARRRVSPSEAYTYSYVTRATTPGEFVAMPARAESTSKPEFFGRSNPDVVRVLRAP